MESISNTIVIIGKTRAITGNPLVLSMRASTAITFPQKRAIKHSCLPTRTLPIAS